MANKNDTKAQSAGDFLAKADDVAKAMANFDNEAALIDGDAVMRELLTGEQPKGVITKVVKLVPTPQMPNPALRGKFLGYEPVEVTPPGGGAPSLMNFVLIEPKPGVILKHLGTSQIMQGMALAQVGQTVTIVRPNVADIEIAGGKRVKVFHVIIDRGQNEKVVGYSKPFGKYGKQYEFADSMRRGSLPAGQPVAEGETLDHDPVTGETK